VEFIAKVRIEVVVADDLADSLADVMARAAHTGNPGDGLIYISLVDAAIRVRTFDRDEQV
jgi:nitrogen regulatory protein PII